MSEARTIRRIAIVGTEGAALLDSGTKIELEGAANRVRKSGEHFTAIATWMATHGVTLARATS